MDARLLDLARAMRSEPSPTEALMWRLLRNAKLSGFRFRRQHIIAPYIADFYCAIAKVVVEADGDSHVGNEVADTVRTTHFESQGCRVLRFWNSELYEDSEAVLETIYRVCLERTRENPKVRHRINSQDQIAPRSD